MSRKLLFSCLSLLLAVSLVAMPLAAMDQKKKEENTGNVFLNFLSSAKGKISDALFGSKKTEEKKPQEEITTKEKEITTEETTPPEIVKKTKKPVNRLNPPKKKKKTDTHIFSKSRSNSVKTLPRFLNPSLSVKANQIISGSRNEDDLSPKQTGEENVSRIEQIGDKSEIGDDLSPLEEEDNLKVLQPIAKAPENKAQIPLRKGDVLPSLTKYRVKKTMRKKQPAESKESISGTEILPEKEDEAFILQEPVIEEVATRQFTEEEKRRLGIQTKKSTKKKTEKKKKVPVKKVSDNQPRSEASNQIIQERPNQIIEELPREDFQVIEFERIIEDEPVFEFVNEPIVGQVINEVTQLLKEDFKNARAFKSLKHKETIKGKISYEQYQELEELYKKLFEGDFKSLRGADDAANSILKALGSDERIQFADKDHSFSLANAFEVVNSNAPPRSNSNAPVQENLREPVRDDNSLQNQLERLVVEVRAEGEGQWRQREIQDLLQKLFWGGLDEQQKQHIRDRLDFLKGN